ncbi:hypothetical protein JCM19992_09070 [Thermostilla marina]
MSRTRYYRLRCKQCGWVVEESQADLVRRLRAAKKIRARMLPTDDVLAELFPQLCAGLRCPDCNHVGLSLSSADHAWDEPRLCEGCGRRIPRERLAHVPDALLCRDCQTKSEAGEPLRNEFCPKCGAPMRLAVASRGTTQFRWVCTNTPPCRLD